MDINHCLPRTLEIAVNGRTMPNNFKIWEDAKNSFPRIINIIFSEKKKIIKKNNKPNEKIKTK